MNDGAALKNTTHQGVYKSSLTNFQVIFLKKIPEDFYVTSHTRTLDIIVILFTGGLPYVQCSKNRLMCENHAANYTIFQERQLTSRRFPVFSGAISNSNSRRFQEL